MDFNKRFLALRDVKRSVCQRLQEKCRRLAAANAELGIDEELTIPQMQLDEEPERREEVSDNDIVAYMHAKDASEAASTAKGAGGFGGFQGKGSKGDKDASKDDGPGRGKEGGTKGSGERRAVSRQATTPEEAIARVAADTPLSALEQAEQTLLERHLVCVLLAYLSLPSIPVSCRGGFLDPTHERQTYVGEHRSHRHAQAFVKNAQNKYCMSADMMTYLAHPSTSG
jgi:hypothetical protein